MAKGGEQVSARSISGEAAEGTLDTGPARGEVDHGDAGSGLANGEEIQDGMTRAVARDGTGAERATAAPTRANGAMIDLDFVRGLIEAVDGSGIDSLEITRGGTRIRIAKTPPSSLSVVGAAPPQGVPPAAVPAAAAPGPAPAVEAAPPAAGAAEPEPASAVSNLIEVKSPMVGTFYRAPAPEAPPYVEVGTQVSKGQTLCILEAMKLMNELESEVDGIVREVLADNADPVEYGQVLFRIEPTGKRD